MCAWQWRKARMWKYDALQISDTCLLKDSVMLRSWILNKDDDDDEMDKKVKNARINIENLKKFEMVGKNIELNWISFIDL